MTSRMTDKIGSKATKPNSVLAPFGVLVGEWQTTGSHPYFPNTELHGRVSFEWLEGGAFLMMRSRIDHPEFPDSVAIFASDDDAGTYYQLYFDERGISRKYDVGITASQLTWWRNDAHFSQRFTMTIEPNRLVSKGEMSKNGGAWERDLSLTCMRV